MAIDASIPLQVRTPEPIDPMAAYAKIFQLKAMQQQATGQQQEQQIRAQQIAEGQKHLADEQTLNDAYKKAWTQNANGVITLDRNTLTSTLAQGGEGSKVPAIIESLDKADKATADALKSRADADAAALDAGGALAAGVRDMGYTVPAFQSAISHLTQNKQMAPDDAKQYLDAVQADPSQVKPLTDLMIARSQKQTELGTARETADSRVTTANTGAARFALETPLIAAQTTRAQQEAAGTTPITPAQQAQQNIERDRLVEEKRKNLVTEKNANPFGTTASGAPATGATGDEFLKTLPPGIASEVKAYAEGRRPFPTGMAMKAPYFQQMIQAVSQYDPSFDAVNFNGRNKSRMDFTAGASAKQITALNTVVGHLGDLAGKSDALGNTDVQSYNTVKNWLKTQVGSADVTNFNTVRKGVTDELTRVWRQAGGSEQDIKTWGESLSSAQSPAQLTGAFSTIAGMIGSRLDALQNQKQQGMGKFGNDIQIVTPKSQAVLDRLSGAPAAPAAASAAGPAAPAGRVRVTGPNGETGTIPEGSALPPGWKQQ